jgi:hypothetical protein
VPIFQAAEDFCVYLILIFIERRLNRWPDGAPRTGYPSGIVISVGMMLWGIERTLDEHLWLGEDGHLGSLLVQGAGVLLLISGAFIFVRTLRRWKVWLRTATPTGTPPSTTTPDSPDIPLAEQSA